MSGTVFGAGVADRPASDYFFFCDRPLRELFPTGTVGHSFAGLELLVGQSFLVTLVACLMRLWRRGAPRAPADRTY